MLRIINSSGGFEFMDTFFSSSQISCNSMLPYYKQRLISFLHCTTSAFVSSMHI